jgi:hypothetical protein
MSKKYKFQFLAIRGVSKKAKKNEAIFKFRQCDVTWYRLKSITYYNSNLVLFNLDLT